MTAKTEKQIRALNESSKSVEALVSSLTEEPYLKNGSKVTVNGSMGQANVVGTFKEENNGWAKVVTEDGKELWVLYHKCMPIDSGINC